MVAIDKCPSVIYNNTIQCRSVSLWVDVSVCQFHSGDFIFKAIFKICFSSDRTSTWECFSQTRILKYLAVSEEKVR